MLAMHLRSAEHASCRAYAAPDGQRKWRTVLLCNMHLARPFFGGWIVAKKKAAKKKTAKKSAAPKKKAAKKAAPKKAAKKKTAKKKTAKKTAKKM